MTALRPHPIHAPSLLIMLGLAKLPESVKRQAYKKAFADETKKKCWLTQDEKDSFFLLLRDLLLSDMSRLEIYYYLHEHQLMPISKKNGVVLAFDTVETYIQETRIKFKIPYLSKIERIVRCVLQDKDKVKTIEETECSERLYHQTLVAMGKKPGKVDSRTIKRVQEALQKIELQSHQTIKK